MESKNIWYLDIKPENLIMDDLGNVYIIDHGKTKKSYGPEDDFIEFPFGTPMYSTPYDFHIYLQDRMGKEYEP